MAGSPLTDGLGGSLGDGFGGVLDDGYATAVLPSGTLQSQLKRFGVHFAAPQYTGRAAPRVSIAPSPIPPPPSGYLPYQSRLSRILAIHFAERPYAGRPPRKVVKGQPPPTPTTGKAFGNQRTLRSYIAHFDTQPYKGRRQNRFLVNYGGGAGLPPRASQLVAEALTASPAGLRASQIILEALTRDPAGVRASQLVAEALYQQSNPAFVRASQLVVEVLVPYTELPVIPYYPDLVALALPIKKTPKQSVGRAVGSSGREIAVSYWANPQWEWDLTYEVLGDTGQNVGSNTQSDIKTMLGFFLSQVGTFGPFYFRDPDDNTVVGQAMGMGDGVTKTFVFVRTYGLSTLGPFTGTEPVGNVDERVTAPVVYIGGVAQTGGFTIDTSVPYGNTVTFAAAPGAGVPITADFAFCYFVRLKEDSLEYSKFSTGLWSLEKATIFSLKN